MRLSQYSWIIQGLLANAKPNDQALANMISDIEKGREDAKKDKRTILMRAMSAYAKYGTTNPFKENMTIEELKQVKGSELTDKVASLTSYQHRIMYYGPREESAVNKIIAKGHKVPKKFMAVPEFKIYPELATDKPVVYWTDYNMAQAEVVFLSKQETYDPGMAGKVKMYNSYFGGGMGAIVFQEMRESRALAYSVYSGYRQASEAGKSNYLMAYIGTQSDKLEEAMEGMVDLIYNMPESEQSFEDAKKSVISSMRTQRSTKSSVLFNYLNAQKKGLNYDIRKNVFEEVQNLTLADVVAFQKEKVKGRPFVICVIGSKDNLDFEALKKYGELKELTLEELFGY
jgi:secreted Zn-dependent insulinase-like peptidase